MDKNDLRTIETLYATVVLRGSKGNELNGAINEVLKFMDGLSQGQLDKSSQYGITLGYLITVGIANEITDEAQRRGALATINKQYRQCRVALGIKDEKKLEPYRRVLSNENILFEPEEEKNTPSA